MLVLVTGAAGFIGSALSEALVRRGDHVIGIDNFNPFYDPRIKQANARAIQRTAEASGGRFDLVRADIVYDQAQLEAIFSDPGRRPDVV